VLKSKVLIVGGTGFIGKNLILKLQKKKSFIIHSISRNKITNSNKIKNVKYFFFDIAKKKNLNKFLKDRYDYIFNLGGNIDHSNKKKTHEAHYLGFNNLSNFFIDKKIKKFIQIGSSVEYEFTRAPQSENRKINIKKLYSSYSLSKYKSTIKAQELFKKKKFPIIIVRVFLAYGPYQKLNRLIPYVINSALQNLSFNCSGGNQCRDYIYIDDVVNFLILLMKKNEFNGEIFNLGSGKPIKIKDLINKICKFIKKGKPKFGIVNLRKDEPLKLFADTKKTKKLLKWRPKYTLESGLLKTISHYRKN
tara:strand:+ start:645 stop:1559 length:915 start_codon:yes stop_codon:yes gene_type:complete